MALQNRVTPFGDIIADPARGTLTGNRGRIHDAATRTLTTRRWTTRAWIICLCAFKGRRRTLMGPGSYTELFFLDEATALAAGHRPCFECQRARAREFHAAFCTGNAMAPGRAGAMDDRLHAERLSPRSPLVDIAAFDSLDDGAMVASGDAAFLWHAGRLHRWSMAGYGQPEPVFAADWHVLTPPSTRAAFKAGFAPDRHPSLPH